MLKFFRTTSSLLVIQCGKFQAKTRSPSTGSEQLPARARSRECVLPWAVMSNCRHGPPRAISLRACRWLRGAEEKGQPGWRRALEYLDRSQDVSLVEYGRRHGERVVQRLGKAGSDDSVPGVVLKHPFPGIGLHVPLHGRQACPESNSFHRGVGQICPR